MKILMLVNWKVEYCEKKPVNKQPPDYCVNSEPYWFYRYFNDIPEVDVIDISSFKWIERFEKNKLRFYIWQTLRVIPQLHKYDLIVSHGMQSGIVLSLWRRLFKTKAKHIVFDIGAFNSAAESGFALKLMQFASKSIDGVIYHTSSQIDYYAKFFSWIVDKCKYVKFGTDLDYFKSTMNCVEHDKEKYIVCVGYTKRDWNTLVSAYEMLDTDIKLRLIGHVEDKYQNIEGIEQIPFVSIKELMSQINNSLFCVLPLKSFNYSYGQMTLMQQMAMEKCVIVADVPSLHDYIEDMHTVVVYETMNRFDLAKKIEWTIQNKKARHEIGLNARYELETNCNEKIMAREIEKIYKNVLSKKENE